MSSYYYSPNSSPASDMSYDYYPQDYSRIPQQQQQRTQRPSGSYPPSYGGYPMSPTTSQYSNYSSTSQYSPTSPDDYEPSQSRRSSNNDPRPAPPQEFFCLFNPCRYTCSRKADLERHVMVTHNRENVPLVDCDYPGCHRRGNYGFTRKDKMRDHKREVHKENIPKRVGGGGGKRESVY